MTRNRRSHPRDPIAAARTVLVALITLGLAAGVPATGKAQESSSVTGLVVVTGLPSAQGAVVYLEAVDELPEQSEAVATMDQRGLDFLPRVLVIPVGGSVQFLNSDTVLHNIFAPDLGTGGEAFDLGTWPAGESRGHRFPRPGVTTILCNVHPEMEAYVLAVPTPHHSVVGPEGVFALDNVPAGEYVLHAWHERAESYARRVSIGPAARVEIGITLLMATR